MKEKQGCNINILNFQLFSYYPTMFSFHRIHFIKELVGNILGKPLVSKFNQSTSISPIFRGKTADLKDYQTQLLVTMSSLGESDKL